MHSIKNPLILTWNGLEYSVNKPTQGTQELVSKRLAGGLKDVLGELINNGNNNPSNELLNSAIKIYNKSLL